MILFIGLRPVSRKVFVDMADYAYRYRQLFGQPFEFDDMEIVRKMKEIVPEYRSNNSAYEVLDRREG